MENQFTVETQLQLLIFSTPEIIGAYYYIVSAEQSALVNLKVVNV